MSPRAACRLRTLGFEQVYDYVGGKADWLAHGLPTEGQKAATLRVKDVVRDDVAICGLEESAATARERVAASPYGFGLVSTEGVVLGRVRMSALKEVDPDKTTEAVMEPGPSTVRAETELETLAERLRERNLKFAIVTTPEGALLGVARRADIEAKLGQS